MDPIPLGPTESVPRRPFTSIALYARDIEILSGMLGELRYGLHDKEARDLVAFEPQEWIGDEGLRHRIIIARPEVLKDSPDVCVVGFFGERHLELDGAPLEKVNTELVLEFRSHLGILSYSSTELPDGNWANLVLHDVPEVREHWRSSEAHAKAARELSPVFYRTVRIHNGILRGGLAGGGAMVIERTKYWDYRRKSKVWYAVRELQPDAALAH
jgi:hypothetical protein